jgi:hypothetical protein
MKTENLIPIYKIVIASSLEELQSKVNAIIQRHPDNWKIEFGYYPPHQSQKEPVWSKELLGYFSREDLYWETQNTVEDGQIPSALDHVVERFFDSLTYEEAMKLTEPLKLILRVPEYIEVLDTSYPFSLHRGMGLEEALRVYKKVNIETGYIGGIIRFVKGEHVAFFPFHNPGPDTTRWLNERLEKLGYESKYYNTPAKFPDFGSSMSGFFILNPAEEVPKPSPSE